MTSWSYTLTIEGFGSFSAPAATFSTTGGTIVSGTGTFTAVPADIYSTDGTAGPTPIVPAFSTEFTGRIGTVRSLLGNIVLGIADSFGLGTFGFFAHELDSKHIRVVFENPVTESALAPGGYALMSMTGVATVPTVTAVSWTDPGGRAVELELSEPLTRTEPYALGASGVSDVDGLGVSGDASGFTASSHDPPRALKAAQVTRGRVDLMFDRPVGPTTTAATATIRPKGTPGPGTAMTYVPWTGEAALTENSVRFALPPGMAAGTSFTIDYSDVVDSSLNEEPGSVDMAVAAAVPGPYGYADLVQLQVTRARVLGVEPGLTRVALVRAWFNGPTSGAGNGAAWTAAMDGSHRTQDTANPVTAPDANDLGSLLALLADVRESFNAHVLQEVSHERTSTADMIASAIPSDADTSAAMLNEVQARLLSHIGSERAHRWAEAVNSLNPLTAVGANVPLCCAIANLVKARFNGHLAASYPLSVQGIGALPAVSDRSSTGSSILRDGGESTFFSDVRVAPVVSQRTPIRMTVSVTSEDGGSSTNPGNYSGSFTAAPAAGESRMVAACPVPESGLDVRYESGMAMEAGDTVSVDGVGARASGRTSVQVAVAIHDQVALSYYYHVAGVGFGIQHVTSVDGYLPTWSMYASGLDIGDLCSSANELKSLLRGHMRSDYWHVGPDPEDISSPDATDEEGYVRLVLEMAERYGRHNSRLGTHLTTGFDVITVVPGDILEVRTIGMVQGRSYVTSGTVTARWKDPSGGGVVVGQDVVRTASAVSGRRQPIDVGFTGSATAPSLASAVPRTALEVTSGGPRLTTDVVEVFFSKPMRTGPVDETMLSVTGGSLIVGEMAWMGPRVVSVQVAGMREIPYSVEAADLFDTSGNESYP
jgi:hypothetical protein